MKRLLFLFFLFASLPILEDNANAEYPIARLSGHSNQRVVVFESFLNPV